MTAPNQGILDDFNRANASPMAGNWSGPTYSGDQPLDLISNAAGGSSVNFFDSYWNPASYTESEVYAELTAVPASGAVAYMHCRIQSPNTAGMDCYELVLTKAAGTDTVDVNRVINASATNLASTAQEVSAGDWLGLVVTGTGATVTLQAWYSTDGVNWTQIGSDISDSNAARITAAGRIGLGVQDATARWDNFGGGEHSETPPPAPSTIVVRHPGFYA
jgi:hypothetical protein